MKDHQQTGFTLASGASKSPRSRTLLWVVCLVASASHGHAAGLISEIDWLGFNAGAERTQFTLVDDNGLTFAQADIQLASGLLLPSSPSAGILNSEFWVTPPDFEDSMLGDSSVATTKIQVAPQSGLARYTMTVTGTDLTGMTFSVGQIFGVAGSGQCEISARTASALESPVNLVGTHGWDDGIRSYTEPVSWDDLRQVLTAGATANGESAISFFEVADVGSPVTQLSFYFPNGYNGATGDAVEFAFGRVVVPEPVTSALVLVSSGLIAVALRNRKL